MNKVCYIGTKTCTKCNVTQTIGNFYSDKSRVDKLTCHCKTCFNKQSIKTRKNKTIEGHLKVLFSKAKIRAKKQNREFTVTVDDILRILIAQNGQCAVTKQKLTHITRENRVPTNISIDRIDSSKGYTPDNVQLICDIVNMMKRDLTIKEFKYWCSLISLPAKNKEKE